MAMILFWPFFCINNTDFISRLSMYFDKMSGKILSIDKTFKILCRYFMSMKHSYHFIAPTMHKDFSFNHLFDFKHAHPSWFLLLYKKDLYYEFSISLCFD